MQPGTFAVLDRVWQDNETVLLQLQLAERREELPGGGPTATVRGPVVLAHALDGASAGSRQPLYGVTTESYTVYENGCAG